MRREVWQNPKSAHELDESQSPLWFLNDKLEHDELKRQLKLKTEVGVTSTILHARGGYIGGYLDEDWFAKMKTVIDYKREPDDHQG
jgi:hypothetical protein